MGTADGYADTLDRLDELLKTPHGDTNMQTTTATDGTVIAYEKIGSGPATIVISNVAEGHTGVAPLVEPWPRTSPCSASIAAVAAPAVTPMHSPHYFRRSRRILGGTRTRRGADSRVPV